MYPKIMWHVILLLLAIISDSSSYFVAGPQNSLKTTGSSVWFNCVTDRKDCSNIEWLKLENQKSPVLIYREGLGMLNLKSFDPNRYNVSAVNGVDGCNLTITNLRLEDSGRFICTETKDGSEKSRSAILVVVEPKPCESVIADMVEEGDRYSMTCSVTVPSKWLEQSNVTLLWFSESKTLVNSISSNNDQHSTLVLAYGGKAEPPAVPLFRCNVSFPPESDPNYDKSPASLIICDLRKKLFSYSVRNIRFSSGKTKFSRGEKVVCIADGSPPPSYTWKNMKTGEVQQGDTITISVDSLPEDRYECNATNEFKGTLYNVTLEATVSEEEGTTSTPYNVTVEKVGIIIGVCVGILGLAIILCFVLKPCPLHKKACKKKSDSRPVHEFQNERLPSEVQYEQLVVNRHPNASSTIYTSLQDV